MESLKQEALTKAAEDEEKAKLNQEGSASQIQQLEAQIKTLEEEKETNVLALQEASQEKEASASRS